MSMAPLAIGLDIGGTKCALSVGSCGETVQILHREEFPTAGLTWQQVLASFAARIEALRAESFNIVPQAEVSLAQLPIGISCGGPLDSKAGLILSPPNLPGWDNVPIVQYFAERFHTSVKLQNDANACAYAEWRFGAGRGAENMVFMTFGTGLGAGLVLGGRLYSGTNDNAGEIGHIRLAPTGPRGYNKDGSAEGFCSGAGMARLAGIRAREGKWPGSATAELARQDALATRELFAHVRAGDPFCTAVFRESAAHLAMILAYTIDILNPEVIVLGGVYMRNADLFEPAINPILAREALPFARKVCRVVPAALSENIGDCAALAIALEGT